MCGSSFFQLTFYHVANKTGHQTNKCPLERRPLTLFFVTSFSKVIFLLFLNPNLSTKLFTQSLSVSKVCCTTFIKFNVCKKLLNPSALILFNITFPFEMSIANQQIKTRVSSTPTAWWNAYRSVECCAWWLCVQQHLSLNTANLWALFVFKHLLSKD